MVIKIKLVEHEKRKNLTIREVTFSTEVERNIKNLQHQNFIKILEFYEHNQNIYVISKLIDISLVQLCYLYIYISEKQLSSITKQLLDAILYLTSQ